MPHAATAPSTRDRLIQTAMKLFWEKGYGSTSIADLLQAAGVNSGSLYHFFPGKQDLPPSWKGVDDPIERVFALLARYRLGIVQTEGIYACPIGSLALEIHEPDPPVRKALAANFKAWTDTIQACLVAAGARLPNSLDRRELSRFVLTTMEGGVMQARTHRDVTYFDSSVRQLRAYFDLLEREAARDKLSIAKPPRKRPHSRGRK
ncbi:MAG: TetR/AcrR family transcriptional regulator [Betaproteobacteria bacterium]|nr:MAG: TetR/AcrR family transcriptional regulator [Betaproteobacteria bacterium]